VVTTDPVSDPIAISPPVLPQYIAATTAQTSHSHFNPEQLSTTEATISSVYTPCTGTQHPLHSDYENEHLHLTFVNDSQLLENQCPVQAPGSGEHLRKTYVEVSELAENQPRTAPQHELTVAAEVFITEHDGLDAGQTVEEIVTEEGDPVEEIVSSSSGELVEEDWLPAAVIKEEVVELSGQSAGDLSDNEVKQMQRSLQCSGSASFDQIRIWTLGHKMKLTPFFV
jgi:hypothetical protein